MTAAYDSIAEWYDQGIRVRSLLAAGDAVEAALFEQMGDIAGRAICDLACGQGDIARKMARRGARVVGVDISQNLLAIARSDEQAEPLHITYHHADVQNLAHLAEEPFDGVLCNMALMDIADLEAAAFGAGRILRLGGWFIASITHPCFQIPPGKNYFDEGFWRSDNLHGVRGQVGAHHRTLSTYLNAFAKSGLLVESVVEPELPNRETPPLLLIRCRRSALPHSSPLVP